MTKRWRISQGGFAAAAMVILILDSETALSGAQKGIDLCIQTVIPSLLPFIVISCLLTGSFIGRGSRFLSPLRRLFQIPSGAESLVLTGLLGGYPVGAQCVCRAYEAGYLSAGDARRLMILCNNSGPAFLFGMTAAIFQTTNAPWILWGIQLLCVLTLSRILPGFCSKIHSTASKPVTLPEALSRSLRVMALVCGWVILFRVIIAFFESWFLWLLGTELQVLTMGILEISNGCIELIRLDHEGLRLVICAFILNFGGLCVMMQSFAVTQAIPNRNLYLPGKLLQGCLGGLFAYIVQLFLPGHWTAPPMIVVIFPIAAVGLCVILRKMQNKSSIPTAVGV